MSAIRRGAGIAVRHPADHTVTMHSLGDDAPLRSGVILPCVLTVDDGLPALRPVLAAAQQAFDGRGEIAIDSGLSYAHNDPVQIRIRRRGRRYDLTDMARAIDRAGRPAGWLNRISRLVGEEGFNVNRRGVVFVPAVEGRDIAALAFRLARISRTVYLDLLDLGEVQGR